MTKTFYIIAMTAILLVGVITPSLTGANAAVSGGIIDKTTFLSDTGATSATGPIPNVGPVGSGPETLGSVTLSSAVSSRTMWFGGVPIGGFNPDWTSLITGNSIALNGPEHLKVEFDSPVYSAGFDFVEPDCGRSYVPCTGTQSGDIGVNWPTPLDSEFNVHLILAGTPVGSFTFNAPNDVASFVGVSGNMLFDTMIIEEIVPNADNEFYGQFYSSEQQPVIPVDIDVKPGSNPSSVSCKNNKGTVPVAVFGSESFDASIIDIEIVSMNLVGLSPIHVTESHNDLHLEDINLDGFDDAVLHLEKEGVCAAVDDAPKKQSVNVILSGQTTDGTEFRGTGDIRVVN